VASLFSIWHDASWIKRCGFFLTVLGSLLPVIGVLWTQRQIRSAQRAAEALRRHVLEPPSHASREVTDSSYWDWFNRSTGRVILTGFTIYGLLLFVPALWVVHHVSRRYPSIDQNALRFGHGIIGTTGVWAWLLDLIGGVLLLLAMFVLIGLYEWLLKWVLQSSEITLRVFAGADAQRIANVMAAIFLIVGAYLLMAPR
jgi:hypothetical protein